MLFNKNCISINKNEYTWDQLKASILQVISNYINSGLPIIEKEDNFIELDNNNYDENDLKVVKMIDGILSSKIGQQLCKMVCKIYKISKWYSLSR